MNWFDDNVLKPEVSGAFGAVVGLLNAPGRNWRERLLALSAGISAAWFLAPAAEQYLGITGNSGQMASAFLIGLVGMNLLAKVIEYIKAVKLDRLLRLANSKDERNEG